MNYLHLYLKIKSYFILYLNKKELNIVKKKSDKFELIYQSESENWWYCYFKKLNPKYIFFVSINTYLPVVRAANKLNIKTIEIQHGTPNTKKLNTHTMLIQMKDFQVQPFFWDGVFLEKVCK